MKKTRLLPIAAISLMISLVGCNWQIPENVSVKTNAEYEFSAGEFNKSLDEYLDIPKILEKNKTTLPNGMKIYDYWPDKANADVQRYLIKVPMAEIPIDLDSFMEQIDLTSGLKAMEFSKEFTVPKIELNSVTGVKLNLENVELSINKGLIGGGTALSGKLYLDEARNVLGTVSYVSGTMTITGNPGNNITLDLAGDGNKSSVTIGAEGSTTLSLAGKTINLAEAKYTSTDSMGFVATVSETSKIKKITDIKNVPDFTSINIPSSETTIPSFFTTAQSGIVNCTIGEGALKFELKGITNAKYTVNLSSTGGLTVPSSTANGTNGHTIPLNNAKLAEGESTLTTSGSVILAGADIDFTSNPELVIKPTITTIASATADIGAAVEFKEPGIELPQQVKDVVKKIVLSPSGFKLTYTNGLPAGNNITIEASSTFLGINPVKTVTLTGGTINGTAEVLCEDNHQVTIGTESKVDFNVKVNLPGSDKDPAHPNYVTISDFTPGKTYNVGLKLEPVLDWKSVNVNLSALGDGAGAGLNFKNTSNLGVNINQMLVDFGTKLGKPNMFTGIELKSMPVYLFCTKPKTKDPASNPFNNIKFKGSAQLKVGSEPLGYILGSAAEGDAGKEELSPVDKIPELIFEKNTNTVINNFETLKEGTEVSLKPKGLVSTLNKIITTNGDLAVEYDLGISGATENITLNKKDLVGTAKIAVEGYIDLGFDLEMTAPIDIDFSKIDGMKDMIGKDVTNGALKTIKDQKFNEYFDVIKEISVNCNLKFLPIQLSEDIEFKMGINNGTKNIDPINIKFRKGNMPITLTKGQITSLFETADPQLKITTMNVTIPAGVLSIPRKKDITTGLSVRLVTDGSIDLMTNGQPAFGGTK